MSFSQFLKEIIKTCHLHSNHLSRYVAGGDRVFCSNFWLFIHREHPKTTGVPLSLEITYNY